MYAENMLGDGAPSKPVEVNLRAFLGHLRAQEWIGRMHATQQEHQQDAAPSIGPALMPSSQGCGDPVVSTTTSRPDSADGVTDTAGINGAPWCPKLLGTVVGREAKQPHGGGRGLEPPLEAGSDAKGATPPQSSVSPPAAFGGDFMGLGGFGEDLVDNLFAPPSSSSRRGRRRGRLRAPAAGGTLGARSIEGEGNTDANGLYPLPPIVLAAGISGESRGTNTTAAAQMRKCDKRGGVCAGTAVEQDSLYDSSVNSTNNDVFHAFINLGRRLPGRLRR